MWSLSVVFPNPSLCLFSHFIQCVEAPAIEHFSSVGAIEALDKGILCRFAGLCEGHLNTPLFTPFLKVVAGKFRAMIHSYLLWNASYFNQLLKGTGNPL